MQTEKLKELEAQLERAEQKAVDARNRVRRKRQEIEDFKKANEGPLSKERRVRAQKQHEERQQSPEMVALRATPEWQKWNRELKEKMKHWPACMASDWENPND